MNADPRVAALRRRAHDRVEPVAGARVIDVGCGTGTDAEELTARGAELVVAVDHDREMVAHAARRPGVVGVVADAHALPFRSQAANIVRTVRVLMHAGSPESVIEEMVRVTLPGGRVLASEPDWSGFTLAPMSEAALEALRAVFADEIAHPEAGRSVVRWLENAGCRGVDVEMATVILRDADRVRADFGLDARLRSAARRGLIPVGTDTWEPGSTPVVAWVPSLTAVGTR